MANISSLLLERRYKGQSPWHTLIEICKGDRYRLILAAIFQIIKHSPVWVMPLIIANVIDLLSKPGPNAFSDLAINMGVLVLIIVQNVPNQIIYMRMLSVTTRNLEMNLRTSICRRLQHLSIGYYTHQSTGTLQTKLIRDVESVQQLLMQVFEPILSLSAQIVAAVAATALREPAFLLFYIVTVPLAVTVVYSLRRPIQQRNVEHRQEVEALSSRLMEMTQMVPITRAHGEEEYELNRVNTALSQVRSAGLQLDMINAVFGSTAFVVMQMLSAIVLGFSAWLYLTQSLPFTLGNVVLLTGYFNALVSSILGLVNLVPQVTKGFEAIRSIGEILECPDLEHNEGKTVVTTINGRITFDHVSFAYSDSRDTAIEDVTLDVMPGETIAFVGHSGAGKSTLLNLVIGFMRPNSGRIMLDSRDMDTLDLRTYRRFLSVVPQETILFDGTIRDNVTYGSREIDDTQLTWALKTANALDFVEQLPAGWDTVVGERGARLSGGQKQRLAIARALIRDPRILVLDEATSALDTLSETLIQEALARLMKGRTTFVVAHRLSTIRNASRIVVMDQGRIVEVGNHESLLAKQGVYSRLLGAQVA
jgi:ATP-binding cassette subfamily B protein